jgi:alkylation response protein AidB-like acyl-CoA dehydrogenase|tara:strand:- start:28241 stop:29242 length:1002 start_codon:yes stop_codon:yes gene_type:complete
MNSTLASEYGGHGLGTDAAGNQHLLWLLAAVGEADLSLACLFEQHLSAVLFLQKYGTVAQVRTVSEELKLGKVFGVWDTDDEENPVHICESRLSGRKLFAAGAGRITIPLVTARDPNGATRAFLLRSNRISYWINPQHSRLVGIRDAISHSVVLAHAMVDRNDEVGPPDSWLFQPQAAERLLRRCAVRAGGLRALSVLARNHVKQGAAGDPLQRHRLAEILLDTEGAFAWLERASAVSFRQNTNGDDVAAFMEMARSAIERAIERAIHTAQHLLGTVASLSGSPAAEIILDLVADGPFFHADQALDNVGTAAIAGKITIGTFIDAAEAAAPSA